MSSIIWLRKFGTILVQSSVSCVLHYMPVFPQDVPLVLVLFMTPLKGLALQAETTLVQETLPPTEDPRKVPHS